VRTTNRAKGFCFIALVAACQVLASCVADRQDDGDAPLTIALRNSGAEPLRCQLIFGHWVERSLGEIAPGASIRLDLMRAGEDGGIYVMRPDGERKMMVENVICGRTETWQATLGQVDLAPLRVRAATAALASCAAPAGAGRVACRLDEITE
jgi:hypothetical protein